MEEQADEVPLASSSFLRIRPFARSYIVWLKNVTNACTSKITQACMNEQGPDR